MLNVGKNGVERSLEFRYYEGGGDSRNVIDLCVESVTPEIVLFLCGGLQHSFLDQSGRRKCDEYFE